MSSSLIVHGDIRHLIHAVRGQRVILDADLARLYGVPTKRLNEQARRNRSRFPSDFMFTLTRHEAEALRSQIATSKKGRGGRRYQLNAFTEHGAIMAANVLNSAQAVAMSVEVVRAFVRLRRMALSVEALTRKMDTLERKFGEHDHQFKAVFNAIRQLMTPTEAPRRKIGFHAAEKAS